MSVEYVAEPSHEISVRAALDLPALRRGLPEVVAGAERLDQPIRWVHAGEVPNMADLLSGGELLLTTGMGIGTRATEQRRFIAELAKRRIAALVVELGSRFQALPGPLVSAAEAHGLPLVQLHREVRFVAVTEAIHTVIVNGHYRTLREGEGLYRQFTEAMLRGDGVPGVLHLLAAHISNPVFLEDAAGRLLSYAGPSDDHSRTAPLTLWNAARHGHPGHTGSDHHQAGPALCVPVPLAGHLVVVPVDSPITPLDRMAVDRAVSVVAMALLRSRQEAELVVSGHGDFLADLGEGRIPVADLARRARLLGFGPAATVMPVVAALRPGSQALPDDGLAAGGDWTGGGWRTSSWAAGGGWRVSGAAGGGDWRTSGAAAGGDWRTSGAGGGDWRMLGHAVREELAALSLSAVLGLRPGVGQVVALVGLGGGVGQRAALAERVAEAFRAAVRRVGVHECGPVVVGSPSSWAGAGAELRHATQAAQAAHHLPPRSWFDARALDVDVLLWVLRDHESLRAFVGRSLGPLLQPEDRRLVATLEVFCRLGGRKTEVARDLGINRQSLYSRLARIETLLGTDLTDPETILTLHLAFRARRTLGTAHETPRAD